MKASKQSSLMTLVVILFAVLMALLFFSCEKPEEPITNKGTVTFWTTEHSGWQLYVDDVKIGSVPKPRDVGNTNEIPSCGEAGFLKLELNGGSHSYHISMLPTQQWPIYLRGQTYFFDITAGGCVVMRAEQ